ncbi:uncharacterized protein P174DRAFT_65027 [Aspergillus novofumigatus IBT 16806]|uniref:Uncharacterized protein n=1 Tax=Aspergillus novofumigatus (strain IBT 16806) TaxID=1392255 RepID=A0A2I1BTJ8_ASPN1|nr:uncharacterized protein P174DRAFT_65027 [Aspergillus novofumigatus IBT 16806]PKX88720.1 hypothetical protein P174DRAFT_65027 [Aspergillus novofumigatus IBT 16806]
MKPVYISAMLLYLFAVQAQHHNSARKITILRIINRYSVKYTGEIKMAPADARRTPALNLEQTVLGIDDRRTLKQPTNDRRN